MANKKADNKKILKIVLVVVIIYIAIITAIIYSYLKSEKHIAQKELQYINSEEWNNELYPDGMPELIRNYSGDLKAQNIGKSMNYMAQKLIPQYYKKFKNKDEKKISKYFKNNENTVFINTGISNDEEFQNLIKEIKKQSKTDELQFESYYIDEDSILSTSQMTEAELYIKYKECDYIKLNIEIYNKFEKDSLSIKYFIK